MPAPLGSYRIDFDTAIAAPPERVWQALTAETARWWPAHFFSSADAQRFVLEPRVGGSVYEDWGNGAGAEWGRIVVFQPPERLAWAGNHFSPSGSDWGRYFLNLLLREEEGRTVLTVQDSAFGLLSDATGLSTEAGWRELFGEHFKKYVEAQ
jgi:uncharacterized protein YndB with AHSA1/START domain